MAEPDRKTGELGVEALVTALGDPSAPSNLFNPRSARAMLMHLGALSPDERYKILKQGALRASTGYPLGEQMIAASDGESPADGAQNLAIGNLGTLASAASGISNSQDLGFALWNKLMIESLGDFMSKARGTEI